VHALTWCLTPFHFLVARHGAYRNLSPLARFEICSRRQSARYRGAADCGSTHARLISRSCFCAGSKGARMAEKDLSKLSRLIEDALAIAVEMDQTTTVYLLSMASIDVTEKIQAAEGTTSGGPTD
jgi:hypothetical protein